MADQEPKTHSGLAKQATEQSSTEASAEAGLEPPGDSRAELASMNARLRTLELEHLQLRIKYLQIQVQTLKQERGDDRSGDPDVEVLEQQIGSLRDRILDFEA